jgi:DDE superfamily endonuclease.
MRYYANKKAWMTMDIFTEVLRAPDVSMGVQGRNVPLFAHNCATHLEDTSFLRNIKTVHYPTNTISVLQPPDLGITKCCRQLHSKHPVHKALYLID